jgi:hypothetical protein
VTETAWAHCSREAGGHGGVDLREEATAAEEVRVRWRRPTGGGCRDDETPSVSSRRCPSPLSYGGKQQRERSGREDRDEKK